MAIKLTQEEFISSLKLVHGDKYDYSDVIYINTRSKIKINCFKHGPFDMTASSHMRGYNCPKCANEIKGENRVKPLSEVISDFKKIHGDKYDYSLVDYVNSGTKVKIICPIHGEFEQQPSGHLTGNGCPKCVTHKNFTQEMAINSFIEVHGDKYDYSLVDYKNSHTKINIICTVDNHGVFKQAPNRHTFGAGCPKCANNYRFTEEEIISRFIEKNGDKYDYSLVKYKNAHTKIKIICPTHGVFKQTPNCHSIGHGCPTCNESKGEKEIRTYLIENNIKFKQQKSFPDCKYKNPLRFDFYLPEYNCCIEFNGIQHYEPSEFFGGVDAFELNQIRDKIKKEYCDNNNIPLIIIRYDEDDIINSLNNHLKLNNLTHTF
jgi:hypothetical protein